MTPVTIVLDNMRNGDKQASEELLPLVYDQLRNLAMARMAHESPGQTLQPTALVHEAWLRLVGDQSERDWKSRAYFFAAAAEAMRRILVERARRKSRLKHGGGKERINIEDLDLAQPVPDEQVLLVDEALAKLEAINPERSQVVVLKFFGGLTNQEVAHMMGMGERSVDRHWKCAKAWLFQRLRAGG